jgi:hypothetical protein
MQVTDQQLVERLAAAISQAAQRQADWTSYVPAVSAAIAAVSSLLSILFFLKSQRNTRELARDARRNSLLPIIIFYRRAERVWIVKNIGNGTATNVVIRNYIDTEQARDEVTLYPITPGEEVRLDYLKGVAVRLVAKYVNVFGKDPHFTGCSGDKNEVAEGEFRHELPIPPAQGHESQIEKWPVTRLSENPAQPQA